MEGNINFQPSAATQRMAAVKRLNPSEFAILAMNVAMTIIASIVSITFAFSMAGPFLNEESPSIVRAVISGAFAFLLFGAPYVSVLLTVGSIRPRSYLLAFMVSAIFSVMVVVTLPTIFGRSAGIAMVALFTAPLLTNNIYCAWRFLAIKRAPPSNHSLKADGPDGPRL